MVTLILCTQFQGNKTSTQISTDYKGSSYTASATAAQVDLLGNSGTQLHFRHHQIPDKKEKVSDDN